VLNPTVFFWGGNLYGHPVRSRAWDLWRNAMGFQHPKDLDEEAKFLDKSRAADFQREFERGGVGKGRANGCGCDWGLQLGHGV